MRNNDKGQALMIVLVILLVLLPMGITIYTSIMSSTKAAVAEGQQKTSTGMAMDVVADYMRAFSNDQYDGHYDDASLGRPLTGYYSNSVSCVTYIANSSSHTLYMNIVSGTGTSQANMQHGQTVSVLIAFISDLVLYGSMFNSDASLSASNVTYKGGMYVNGNFSESGSGVTWAGGPLVVTKTATGGGNTVDGSIYYGTAESGFTITGGGAYNTLPSFTWPTFNTSYYASHAATTTTVDQTIVFNAAGTFTMGGVTYTIPSNGVIIYGNNANFNISGTVKGLVTVVAYDSSNSTKGCSTAVANGGTITVSSNLIYSGGGGVTAGSGSSFAALASDCILFQGNGSMTASGVFFVQNTAASGYYSMEANCMDSSSSCNAESFILSGTRSDVMYQGVTGNAWGTTTIEYDSGLRSTQPPGLPEKAYVVGFNVK